MLENYIKISLRNLRKEKIYSTVNIIGLPLALTGLAANNRRKEIGILKILGASGHGKPCSQPEKRIEIFINNNSLQRLLVDYSAFVSLGTSNYM